MMSWKGLPGILISNGKKGKVSKTAVRQRERERVCVCARGRALWGEGDSVSHKIDH